MTIERMLREEEKGNIMVLPHIELTEFHPAGAKGTGPHWARDVLDTILYSRTSAIG